jgi:hypothetical protein
MTQPTGFGTMASMRTLVIVATLSIGALRIMWRSLSPSDPLGSREEWTADE